MADNIQVTEGSGKTVGTKDVSSVHYQRVMPGWGGAGVFNDTSEADPLPVQPTAYLALPYQKVTTLGSDVTLGAAGATGDALDSITIHVRTAASTVTIKDNATTILEWVSLAVGTYGPYAIGMASASGAWKVNIGNASATGSWVTASGVFTEA